MIKLLLIFVFELIVSSSHGQYRHRLIADSSMYKNNAYVIILTNNEPPIKSYDYIIDYTSFDLTRGDTAGNMEIKITTS